MMRLPPAGQRGADPAGAEGWDTGSGAGRERPAHPCPWDGVGGGCRCLAPEVGRSTWLSFNSKWQTVVKALAN